MVKVSVYNQEGKSVGELELAQDVFAVEMRPQAIAQVVHAQAASARKPYAHTKDRSEVRGGGKKPWKQKGTGRARHGSIRSPLWVGGGITFGPTKERNYAKKINKKARRAAVKMCLSDKVRGNKFIVLESLGELKKTRDLEKMLMKLPSAKHSTLLTLGVASQDVLRSVRNLEYLATLPAKSLNVGDVLKYEYLVTTKEGVETMTQALANI